MKAIGQYFHVVLFIMLYKVILINFYKTVDETLVCDYSSESHWLVRSCAWFIMLYQVVLINFYKTVDETLIVCDHSNKSFWAVLSSTFIPNLVYKYRRLFTDRR